MKYFIHKATLLCLFFSMSAMMLAQTSTTYIGRLLSNQVFVNGTINLEDPVSPSAGTVVNRHAKVALRYTRDQMTDLAGSNWSYRVSYSVAGANDFFQETLHLNFKDDGHLVEDLKLHTLTEDQYTLTILTVEASDDGFQSIITNPQQIDQLIPDDVELRAELEVVHHDHLSSTALFGTWHEFVPATNKLRVEWKYLKAADKFEIEWIFQEDVDGGGVLDLTDLDEKFKSATSAETHDNSYEIPLVYPQGFVYYRYRPIGKFVQNQTAPYIHRKEGEWTYPDPESFDYNVAGFSEEWNWQYTNTFAEEGKSKQVVSYFDDGLRNRQTITNLSTEEQSLVATSHYDVEGRPTLNILPVPAQNDNSLFYKPKFNKPNGVSDEGYNRFYFDRNNGIECAPILPGSLEQSATGDGIYGAGHYYSSNNMDESPFKDMIPDAKGYPMTQMKYMNDGTGRVVAQGGVGIDHQLGSGHETNYYYTRPSDTRLKRLFGSNVGKNKFYKRNLVKDANDQVSVSYLDQAGRVIATSLLGNVPRNVEALPDGADPTAYITEDFSDDDPTLTADGYYCTTGDIFNNSIGGQEQVVLNYSLSAQPESLTDLGISCIDCKYEVVITVVDPCNDLVDIMGDGKNEFREIYETQCPDSQVTDWPKTITFYMNLFGNYTVTKKLRAIERTAAEWKAALADNLDGLAVPHAESIISNPCFLTCEQYNESLPEGMDPLDCDDFDFGAVAANSCEYIYAQIISQVSPGGCLFENYPTWWNEAGGMTNASRSLADLHFMVDIGNGVMEQMNGNDATMQAYLADPSAWQDGWAEVLATIHPAYMDYQYCLATAHMQEFEMELSSIQDWSELEKCGLPADQEISMDIIDLLLGKDLPPNCPAAIDPAFTSYGYFYGNIDDYTEDEYFIAHLNAQGTFPDVISLRTTIKSALENYPGIGGNVNSNIVDIINNQMDLDNNQIRFEIFKAMYLAERKKQFEAIWATWRVQEFSCGILGGCIDPDAACADPNDPPAEECPECGINPLNELLSTPPPANDNESTITSLFETIYGQNITDNFVPYPPTDPSQHQDMTGFCDDLVAQVIGNWLESVAWCSGLLPGSPQMNQLEEAFLNYLENTCPEINPLSLFITEFPDDTDQSQEVFIMAIQDLLFAFPMNNPNYGGVFDNCWEDFLSLYEIEWGELYTYVTDEEGKKKCVEELDVCYESLIAEINLVLGTSTASNCGWADGESDAYTDECFLRLTYYYPGSGPYDARGGISIAWDADHQGCCSFWSFWQPSKPYHILDLCTVQEIISYDGDIYLPAFDKTFSSFTIKRTNGNIETAYFLCEGALPDDGPGSDPPPPEAKSSTDPIVNSILNCFDYTLVCEIMIKPAYEINVDDWKIECEASYNALIVFTQELLDAQVEDAFVSEVMAQTDCLGNASEVFNAYYKDEEHHFTLYYYDQAGNLIQTVPPIGVDVLPNSDFDDGVWQEVSEPAHTQITRYNYNSIGSLKNQNTPDAAIALFKYDYAGRLRFSQDARQAYISKNGPYSFTKYDGEGRIIQTGEILPTANFGFETLDGVSTNNLIFPSEAYHGVFQDEVTTVYSRPEVVDPGFIQENLQGRVATTENDNVLTRYSYDEHGNVKSLQHEIGLGINRKFVVDYEYDLISGNVNQVAFQKGGPFEQFYHRYSYDADNRLERVFTSDDGEIWEEDARYFYYSHGPLARVEIGEDKVQGMDYYYTLHGWIKGVNQPRASEESLLDPGLDGAYAVNDATNTNALLGRDAASYALGYYVDDYRPIGPMSKGFVEESMWDQLSTGYKENGLYNGNIAWMATHIGAFNDYNSSQTSEYFKGIQARGFKYDQLHRIVSSNSFDVNQVIGDSKFEWLQSDDYKTAYSYDANGNLDSLWRWGKMENGTSALMDELVYDYYDNTGENLPNRLERVIDNETNAQWNNTENILPGQAAENYQYDAIGNLISDAQAGVTNIDWNVFGKVRGITKSDGSSLEFSYDPAGNRLAKTEDGKSQIYIRDASGNLLALYEHLNVTEDLGNGTTENTRKFSQQEVPLYGSSRLGLQRYSLRVLEHVVTTQTTSGLFNSYVQDYTIVEPRSYRGDKYFEISNHLGNVLSVVSDQKVGIGNINGLFTHYEAGVQSASDYYPFGLQMPERTFSSPEYRYGFNGKEKDEEGEWGSATYIDPDTGEEMENSLTHYDYGFRIYNPGIGRFLSVDPLTKHYSMLTPYQFASNTPIAGIDLDGLEILLRIQPVRTIAPPTAQGVAPRNGIQSAATQRAHKDISNPPPINTPGLIVLSNTFPQGMPHGPLRDFYSNEASARPLQPDYYVAYRALVYGKARDEDEYYWGIEQQWLPLDDYGRELREIHNSIRKYTDVSKLSERELREIRDRVNNGQGSVQDNIYAAQARKRGLGVFGNSSNLPRYENPGHHDPNGGPNHYNPDKSILPDNHEALWKDSQLGADGNRWTKVGKGKNSVYHRFQDDGNGNWHWNGSTDGVTKKGKPRKINLKNVPVEIKRS